ncbi:MAG: hypothetical protein C9356_14910 [Oleiphilus sp.]|nr:MAG: hypothetical protein C9356_14910 [Oleiphilus sp.]
MGAPAVVGNAILIERSPDDKFVPFKGFMTLNRLEELDGYEYVPAINVEAFTLDDDGLGGWLDIPAGQAVIAVKSGSHDGFYVPIFDQQLIAY